MHRTDLRAKSPNAASVRVDGMAAMALLLIGLYLPTSIGADFSKILLGLLYLLCLGIFGVLLVRTRNAASFPACLTAALIVPVLLVFTATSSLHSQAPGALVLYGVLSVMFMLNLKDISLPPWGKQVFFVVNAVNIAAGIAILLGIQTVNDFIIRFYTTSSDYAELVQNMLLFRKPVLTFGTHSLAGFFFYMFFHINWQAYRS